MPVGMQLQLSPVHAKYKSVQEENNNLLLEKNTFD